ncbi:MAG: helix-turn-helix domain-containing protein [Chloroflexota bacterium]
MYSLTAADIDELEEATEELRRTRPKAARILVRILDLARSPDDTLWTTAQVARALDVSTQTVRNWVDAGWLPAERAHPLGRRRIPASALAGVWEFRAARSRGARVPLTDEQVVAAIREQRQAGPAVARGPRHTRSG